MKKQITPDSKITLILLSFMSIILTVSIKAQTTVFTYQGRFTDSTLQQQPTNGTYNMQFALFGSLAGNDQIGSTITNSSVQVAGGVFTVQLNFAAANAFDGTPRYLEIRVFDPATSNYITLTPRQLITSSPYAIQTIRASIATNAENLGGVAASNFVQTSDSRLTDARTPTPGSNNYIQNTTSTQINSNFSISGGGTANGFSLRSGGTGLTLNDNLFRLRASSDNNHAILYSATVDGPEFRAFSGFRWTNGFGGATERMRLESNGTLTVTGDLISNGTIKGTLEAGSIGTAQVADGSLRLTDTAVFVSSLNPGNAFVVAANNCSTFSFNLSAGTVAVGDIMYIYLPSTTPPGIYVAPTVLTNATNISFGVCNSTNANLPVSNQSFRVAFIRP